MLLPNNATISAQRCHLSVRKDILYIYICSIFQLTIYLQTYLCSSTFPESLILLLDTPLMSQCNCSGITVHSCGKFKEFFISILNFSSTLQQVCVWFHHLYIDYIWKKFHEKLERIMNKVKSINTLRTAQVGIQS